MSFLTEPLPQTVEIDGKSVPICADYRVILRIDALRDTEMPEDARGVQALLLFYGGKLPQNIEAATQAMLYFMRCGRQETTVQRGRKPSAPDFSFDYDAPLIYAAFLTQYQIDLQTVDFLHWWKFRALFDGLDREHLFCEVRRCRSMDLSTVESKELRKYYASMKKAYALPLPEGEQKRLDALAEALMRGGEVKEIL